MKEACRHYAWIILIAGLVFFVNLGGPKLWDRDEPRNAGCALEMSQRGDWIVPMFNGDLRAHKPVLLYWLMMGAYAVFGVNEFAARLPSALAGLGTVLATYHIGRRLFSAQAGLWASVVLASSMMFPVAARAATPDSVLIFFTTLATWVYVYGAFPAHAEGQPASGEPGQAYFPRSWGLAALMYALMGAAVLAKGPVGLVLPTAVIGMFLLVMRLPPAAGRVRPRRLASTWIVALVRPFAPRHFLATCWSMRPLTALGASLAVALPWYLWVGCRTEGAWLKGFFLVHHLQRTLEPMEGHNGSPFYYLVVIFLSFFPWSLLLIPALRETAARLGSGHPWRPQYVLLASWGAVYVVAFSLASTKLPSYVSPTLPAFALLTGCFVQQWTTKSRSAHLAWLRFALGALFVVGLALMIAIPIASRWILPGGGWIGLLGLIPMLGAVVGGLLLRRFRWDWAIRAFALTAILFACGLFGFASQGVSRHQRNDALFRAARAVSAAPQFAAYGRFEPSWVFYARQPVRMLSRKEAPAVGRFLSEDGDRFVVMAERDWRAIRSSLPPEAAVLAQVPYFMRRDQLLLIGRQRNPSQPWATAANGPTESVRPALQAAATAVSRQLPPVPARPWRGVRTPD